MNVLKYAKQVEEIKNKSGKILKKIINNINIKGQIDQEDIKIFYSYFTELSNIINTIKPNIHNFNDHLKEQKINLIKKCEKNKEDYINFIIDLSYTSFMDSIK